MKNPELGVPATCSDLGETAFSYASCQFAAPRYSWTRSTCWVLGFRRYHCLVELSVFSCAWTSLWLHATQSAPDTFAISYTTRLDILGDGVRTSRDRVTVSRSTW